MEGRVTALEQSSRNISEKLIRIEMRLEAVESQMATKAELAKLATRDDLSDFVRASSEDVQELAVATAEASKFRAETTKFSRDAIWYPVAVASGLIGATAAATVAITRFLS